MLNYGTKSDRDGMFYDIFKTAFVVEMCGYTEDEIWAIVFEEAPDGEYWSFQDTGEDDYHLIFPHEILFNVCFPYGVQVEVDAGRGRVVRLRVVKSISLIELRSKL